MQLTLDQMDAILQANKGLLEQDENAIALEFDFDDTGGVVALVLSHRSPAKAMAVAPQWAVSPDMLPELPLRIELGDLPEEQICTDDVMPMFEEAQLVSNFGMSGTRVCEGTGCGTLCLSGAFIRLQKGAASCGNDGPFLFSNSHVFHRAGGRVLSQRHTGTELGQVVCVFDLETDETFDGGVASATAAVPGENAFKCLKPGSQPIKIAGLMQARSGMRVAKMGMVSGWTEGTIGGPTITRISGRRALYPSWTASYRSRPGDSGAPVLHWSKTDGCWYLVGIHFASGPRFHSWNNVEIAVG
jgi:hypothetical protein